MVPFNKHNHRRVIIAEHGAEIQDDVGDLMRAAIDMGKQFASVVLSAPRFRGLGRKASKELRRSWRYPTSVTAVGKMMNAGFLHAASQQAFQTAPDEQGRKNAAFIAAKAQAELTQALLLLSENGRAWLFRHSEIIDRDLQQWRMVLTGALAVARIARFLHNSTNDRGHRLDLFFPTPFEDMGLKIDLLVCTPHRFPGLCLQVKGRSDRTESGWKILIPPVIRNGNGPEEHALHQAFCEGVGNFSAIYARKRWLPVVLTVGLKGVAHHELEHSELSLTLHELLAHLRLETELERQSA